MVNQYNPKTHVGEQPIRVLQNNMTYWLHNTSEEFRRISLQLAEQKKLNVGITYRIGCDPINSKNENGNPNAPYISHGTIQLHESFLSYLWFMAYSIYNSHDTLIRNERIRGKVGLEIFEVDPNVRSRLETIISVFAYGVKLINEYYPWDIKTLPNPEYFSESDQDTIGKINAVYLSAISFILCHEVAHSYLNHSERKIQEYRKVGKIDTNFQKSLEQESDLKAIEWLLKSPQDGSIEYTRKVGIIVGACSLLFLSKSVNSNTHPDTDARIKYIIESCLPGDNSEYWALACIAFNLWDDLYRVGLEWKNNINQTYEELFKDILNQ